MVSIRPWFIYCELNHIQMFCYVDYAKFHRSANSSFGKVANSASEEVISHLVCSKHFSLLLYGLEEDYPIKKSEINSLNLNAIGFSMELFRS